MHSGVVPYYQPCLLMWCFIIGHVSCCGTSLSAMPVGVVPHYRPCLLMWYLTVCHAFWCGASLWAMTSGVVPHHRLGGRRGPHYRPCLQVYWHFNQYFTIQVRVEDGWLQFCCYSYRGAITSDMASDPVSLSDMAACTVNSIRHACWVHLFRYTCL